MKKVKLLSIVSMLLIVLSGCGSTTSAKNLHDQEVLNIAIAPTNDPEIVQLAADLWTEQLNTIFKDMGYTLDVNITIATDPAAITAGVASGQTDVGFVPASNYVIAKAANPDDISVFMQGTRNDRNSDGSEDTTKLAGDYDSALYINTEVYENEGMDTWTNEQFAEWVSNGESTIAVSSYTSPASYIWPVNFLLDNSMDPNAVNWSKVDNNFTALQQVADGNADATFSYFGVNQDIINSENENYANINETTTIAVQNVGQVRVPNDVTILNSKFDEESRNAIFSAYETMASTPEGVDALQQAYGWIGVTSVNDDDANWTTVQQYLDASAPYTK